MRVVAAIVGALVIASVGSGPVRAQTAVDLELVFAVDVSRSMDLEEQRLQREGYIEALTDPAVLAAIRAGFIGRIGFTYFEWAGPHSQNVIVPWTVLEDEASIRGAAALLAEAPLRSVLDTSISEALFFATDLFDQNDYDGIRRVIDVSGDGPNNLGRKIEPSRDAVVEQGIVINGLPIMIQGEHHGPWNIRDLDVYYKECVIGGPGSFVVPINGFENFAEGVRRKLILEIAGLMPEDLRQSAAEPTRPVIMADSGLDGIAKDCMIGEKLRQQWFGMSMP